MLLHYLSLGVEVRKPVIEIERTQRAILIVPSFRPYRFSREPKKSGSRAYLRHQSPTIYTYLNYYIISRIILKPDHCKIIYVIYIYQNSYLKFFLKRAFQPPSLLLTFNRKLWTLKNGFRYLRVMMTLMPL